MGGVQLTTSNNRVGLFKRRWMPGDNEIPSDWLNTVSAFVANFRVHGAEFTFNGRVPVLNVRRYPETAPFDLLEAGTGTGTVLMRVYPGTATATPSSGASSVVPLISATALNADPYPTLSFSDTGSEDGTHEVYLGCEINGSGQVIAGTWTITHRKPGDAAVADVAYNATGPVNGEAYLLLGTFEVDSGALVAGSIANMIRSSVMFVVCDEESAKWVWSGFRGAD